jgi:ABC-2 type transporter
MTYAWVLGQRALPEAWRTPEALLPTLFIPLFFLVVNVGQAGKIFPAASTGFLAGQSYAAFQLPNSLLLAASFGTAALFLVEDIEGGYFDKLRATPIPRAAIVLGRLVAELVKGLFIAALLVVLALAFGISVASGPLGFLLVVALTAAWSVVFVGFMQLIALKTRSAAATLRGPRVLPAPVPHAQLRSARAAHAADGGRRVAQPDHLRHGGAALADPPRPDLERRPRRLRCRRGSGGGDDRAQRARHPSLRLIGLR